MTLKRPFQGTQLLRTGPRPPLPHHNRDEHHRPTISGTLQRADHRRVVNDIHAVDGPLRSGHRPQWGL